MPGRDVEGLPSFPQPPPGTPRMEHLPTVEASIRYWEAVRDRAIRARDHARELTAMGLRRSYEAALAALTKAKAQPPESGDQPNQRKRPPRLS
jgi:hypothetical protein